MHHASRIPSDCHRIPMTQDSAWFPQETFSVQLLPAPVRWISLPSLSSPPNPQFTSLFLIAQHHIYLLMFLLPAGVLAHAGRSVWFNVYPRHLAYNWSSGNISRINKHDCVITIVRIIRIFFKRKQNKTKAILQYMQYKGNLSIIRKSIDDGPVPDRILRIAQLNVVVDQSFTSFSLLN